MRSLFDGHGMPFNVRAHEFARSSHSLLGFARRPSSSSSTSSFSLSLSLSSNRETLTLSQFFKRLVAAASGRQAPYMMGLTMSPISILFHCYSWFFFIALFKTIAGILESARSQNSHVNTAVHCAWEGRQRKRESDAAAAALRCDTRGWACCASPQPSTSTGPTLTACMSPCNLCHMKINL